jgi:hypothetical protein
MDSTGCLTTDRIRSIFAEEIDSRGGTVQKVDIDGGNLYCRATLPVAEEIAIGDRVRAGAALRATPSVACICPWLLRTLCINGIIVRKPMPEREVEMPLALPADVAEFTLREAIAGACSEEAFADAVKTMRAARRRPVQLDMTPFRRRMPGDAGTRRRLLMEVMRRFREEGDRSAFGLTNAVTSLARDTADPETRWRLEELGGSIAAGRIGPAPALPDAIAKMLSEEVLQAVHRGRADVQDAEPAGSHHEEVCGAVRGG